MTILQVPWRRTTTAAAALACALASGTAAHAGPTTDPTPKLTTAQRKVVVEASKRFHDVKTALAEGYLPAHACSPGMGYHYVHPALSADTIIDPVRPEVLLYDKKANLLGVEYFKADTDGDLKTDTDRPTLFGNRFDGPMLGHEMPHGAPPMPVHYDLHVWLYHHNPSGELATTNPRVTCP